MIRHSLRRAVLLAALGIVVGVAGCARNEESATGNEPGAVDTTATATDTAATGGTATGTMPVTPATPPAHIEVQHVLVGFEGSVPQKTITRTREEARTLAHQILDRARKGENFDALVNEYTNDQAPGIYKLANTGVTPGADEFERSGMVKGFSDAAFSLSPGNIGIAEYDPTTSPYGWHVIKRLR